MTHTLLREDRTDAELIQKMRDNGASAAELRRNAGEVRKIREMFLEGSFTELRRINANFTFESAVDEDGNRYDDVTFVIEARYMRDGDVYLAGGGFVANASEMLRRIEGVIEALTDEG